MSYLAIQLTNVDLTSLQILTPMVMLWDRKTTKKTDDGEGGSGTLDVWVMDLDLCQSYWRIQAERSDVEVRELFRQIFNKEFGVGNYRAVCSDHPWKAVTMLSCMANRELDGIIDLEDRFGCGLYQELSWEDLESSLEVLSSHYQALKTPRFRGSVLRSQMIQLRKSMERLGIKKPWDFRQMDIPSIKRRFGATIAKVWGWAYGIFHSDLFESGFPWRAYEFKNLPQVNRTLDHSIYKWDQMEPLLLEDLNRLCSQSSWDDRERVVSLELRLTFADLTALPISIHFRHPHSLHQELTHQRTALLQANYAFERETKEAFSKFIHEPIETAVPTIIGWELIVTGRIRLPQQVFDIFGEDYSDQVDLCQLENRLSINLESFNLSHDWLPEHSYALAARDRKPHSLAKGSSNLPSQQPVNLLLPFQALARKRPLFLYKTPQPWDDQGRSSGRVFLERTMEKWWSDSSQETSQRDYYCLTDSFKRDLWVYKDNRGRWYAHGIFA